MKKSSILFLVGPTAVGKTQLALRLAHHLNGEIISADSMLVYKKMNIGTAKPNSKIRRKIRHHLIDQIEPTKSFSVFEYRTQALKAIDAVLKRKKTPIVVGGSGLYVSSLLDGLAPQSGGSVKFRKKMEALASKKGVSHLYERLKQLDSKRASEIHATDQRRIIRALEIIELSGKKPSELKKEKQSLNDLGYHFLIIGLNEDREKLYERINARVLDMVKQGWLKEAKRLNKLRLSVTAEQAVGYRELFDYIKGKQLWPQTLDLIQRRTRHLAKKQWTWFGRDMRIHWLKLSSKHNLKWAQQKTLQLWKKFTS